MREGNNIYYPTPLESAAQDDIHQKAMRMVRSNVPIFDVVIFLRRNYKGICIKYKAMQE